MVLNSLWSGFWFFSGAGWWHTENKVCWRWWWYVVMALSNIRWKRSNGTHHHSKCRKTFSCFHVFDFVSFSCYLLRSNSFVSPFALVFISYPESNMWLNQSLLYNKVCALCLLKFCVQESESHEISGWLNVTYTMWRHIKPSMSANIETMSTRCMIMSLHTITLPLGVL